MKKVINFVLYNFGWIAAVVGASRGCSLCGIVVNLIALIIHLILMQKAWRRELVFAVTVGLLGSLIDATLPALKYISFSSLDPSFIGIYPLWMTSLWIGFATTISLSLSWIQRRYLLGVILGALGGPASLLAGVGLGAAQFHGERSIILAVNSIQWAFLIPVILLIHARLIPLSQQEPPRQE